MSVRKEIYNTISAKLKELKIFDWIDLYKGQLTNKNDSYPTGFPAAFISIGRIKWDDMTMGIKEGNGLIKIYLFFNKGGDTFVDAKDKDDSLLILDTQDNVIEELEGIENNCFTPLSQTDEEDVTEGYQRPAYIITFETIAYKRIKKPNYVLN